MKSIYTLLVFLLCLFVSSVQAATYQPLLEAQQLSAALETNTALHIIDIRSPADYAAGHIAGAVSAPYGQWRGPANNPGQLADVAYFQQLTRQLGLTDQQPIVVYSSGANETDFGATARVYWTLKYLGLTDLTLLNGGFKQWQQALQPIEVGVNQPLASNYTVQINARLAIDKNELLAKITQQDTNYQLLDARPPAFFEGKVKAPTASTGGTIATAESTPFQQWFNNYDTRIRSTYEVLQLVREQGLDQAEETVSFCNTGHWAATNWFVLSEVAGLPNVRLYPASLAEWTQSSVGLPMENTPNRWEQIQANFSKLVSE
ncbi:MAG TPA: sulfurtransferase [Marinospirillum sp.]|uniref:sulfurtransferase n=1 Tax=Marinospirillum sp. TaxID=2183934 RepID=UPI002B4A3567|nr:sulfurtransferase [Marinospirillum sp.]HKM15762.1 sulfurtransferase [Marinospirillum sp.]